MLHIIHNAQAMIADLDRTIRQLLIDELPIRNGEIDITFDQPKREWSGRLSRPALNFFLYDVRENVALRQNQLNRIELERNGDRTPGTAHLRRTALRLDCFYMLTAWAKDPLDEHRLLTNAMLALFKYAVLPAGELQGRLANPAYPIQTRLANHDVLTNPAEVWSALDNEMRPSISYVVTLALDPWTTIETPEVQAVELWVGEAKLVTNPQQPDAPPMLSETVRERRDSDQWYIIAGRVRDVLQHDEPVVGVEVQIKETGLYTRTDEQGRYRFRRDRFDDQELTLVVHLPGRPAVEKRVHVQPGHAGEYTVDIVVVREPAQ